MEMNMTKPRVRVWEVRNGDNMGTRYWILDDYNNEERVHGEDYRVLAIAYAQGLCADSFITGAEEGIRLDLDLDKPFDPLDFVGTSAEQIRTAYEDGRADQIIFEDVQ